MKEKKRERESVCLCVCLYRVFVVGRTKRAVEVARRQPSNPSTYAFPKQDLFKHSAITTSILQRMNILPQKKQEKQSQFLKI